MSQNVIYAAFFYSGREPTYLWVIVGTMGYGRNYGLRSELWVTIGIMGRGWKVEVPFWPVIGMNGKLG